MASDFSLKQKVLERLVRAMKQREELAWPPGSLNKLPPGELPMPVFQGAECGGSGANVRLNELRMPEQAKKSYSGIPIVKNVRWYEMDGEQNRVVTYKLGISNPANIDRFIDFEHCRLNKQAVADAGGVIIEIDDDANGHDKAGKAVRIITKQEHEKQRDPFPLRKKPDALHPLAPQLSL